jgi:fatty acid desaturase
MTPAQYREVLDPIVRPEKFGRDRAVLWHLAAHSTVIVGLGLLAAHVAAVWPIWAILGLAVVAGHSVGLAAFAAHEIGHGAVMKPGPLRAICETLGWLFALFATPTLMQRAHNGMHHGFANTPRDPDRRPNLDEIAMVPPVVASAMTFLFPNRRHPLISAVLGFSAAICSYHIHLLVHSVQQIGTRYDMGLPASKRRRVLAEFALNLSAYVALWLLSGRHPAMIAYLWLMYATATTLDGLYIATNHTLTGQADVHDPVAQTVSLRIPAWLDVLHLRFSHHTEHHLYPHAGPKHYPAIRAALREKFPDRYQEMTWGQALGELVQSPLALAGTHALCDPDGASPRQVALRKVTVTLSS